MKKPISPQKPEYDLSIGFARKVRKEAGAFLEHLWELSRSIRFHKVDAVVIEGSEKHSGAKLTCFYLGHYNNYAYMLGQIYADFSIREKTSNISSVFSKKWVDKYKDQVDLLFIDVELLYSKFFKNDKYLQIPYMVRQKLELPETWEEVLRKFRKSTREEDLRKIRKYGLSYKTTRDEKDFIDFYRKMYQPFVQKRFGDAAIISPERKVIRQCKKGELMHILRGEDVVAGVLLHHLEGRLANCYAGIPDGLDSEMYEGAFSAQYYYAILYGYESGCHEVDFLLSRPLLNDGVFQFKRKWGMLVEDSPVSKGDLLLKPLRFSEPVMNIFSHNFFITRDGNGLAGKILFKNHKMTRDDVNDLWNRYFTQGLTFLKIYSMNGFEEGACQWLSEHAEEVQLIDLEGTKNPHTLFCSSRFEENTGV